MTEQTPGSFSLAEHKAQPETHTVFNQPAALTPYNTYLSDLTLQYWTARFEGDYANARLRDYGALCGGELAEAGILANRYLPEFHSHDRFGNRIDEVRFQPAYHQLMQAAISAGMHALPWTAPQPGAHVARAALVYQHMQADAGTGCPLTMTFAAVPALAHAPELARDWLPKITASQYDERNIPYFAKKGLTIGMAMTEKQGGSDVRANTTRAYPLATSGEYELVGHKWFCSAPMCDAFLTLAYTDAGLSCFLLPRWRPDGSKNQFYIQRLKDKLGNCSNASSEVEFRGAFAWRVGDEGRGVATIIEMVAMTRFDCMTGSAALMRAALAQALQHTAGRSAFGKNLQQQPLMQNVLADLVLESEAALALSMRVAHALDLPEQPQQQHFMRLATAVGKYWICKRAPQFCYEAMECIGGVGYVEENILPRLYREAPVNAIWEGSGNVQCLDVLRAITKTPEVMAAYFAELEHNSGQNTLYDKFVSQLKPQFSDTDSLQYRARTVVDQMALALQASVLLQYGEPWLAEAYISSRLTPGCRVNFGTLPAGIDCAALISRAQPKL
ncbi:acyl-CoA dehydrogenase family protein [Arsukibacterium sp.]|uniref:acyl-CoA dehydrogenase family protein n=1 Tax=Arsukibacterium sp. TaxID=1977258 RepID=UPI00299F023B|nr:acyl-CoA dehydrogenase family protein [Arsukibacterium sp.]MDX1678575.1 acyl-CoA dehydrogenase family protein [Arsukibacterium sp.]